MGFLPIKQTAASGMLYVAHTVRAVLSFSFLQEPPAKRKRIAKRTRTSKAAAEKEEKKGQAEKQLPDAELLAEPEAAVCVADMEVDAHPTARATVSGVRALFTLSPSGFIVQHVLAQYVSLSTELI